jgi:hypothetical protein
MTAGIAYAANEEMVVLQSGSLEAVDVLLFRSSQYWYVVLGALGMVWVKLQVRS